MIVNWKHLWRPYFQPSHNVLKTSLEKDVSLNQSFRQDHTFTYSNCWPVQDNCTGQHSCLAHLGTAHADDAVHIPVAVVEEGDGDGMLAGRKPVPLGGRVYLEDVRSGTEDGLFPSGEKHTMWFNNAALSLTAIRF